MNKKKPMIENISKAFYKKGLKEGLKEGKKSKKKKKTKLFPEKITYKKGNPIKSIFPKKNKTIIKVKGW